MVFRRLVLIASSSLIFTGLGGAQELRPVEAGVRPLPAAASYFPLVPGSTWFYEQVYLGETYPWFVRVGDRGQLDPRLGYIPLEGFSGDPPGSGGAPAVRTDRHGQVLEWDAGEGREFLWYRLHEPVGTTWTLDLGPASRGRFCDHGAQVTVAARDEVVEVPAGTFENVVRLTFVPQCFDGGTLAEWFAPGVGMIRRVTNSAFGEVVSELVSVGHDRGPQPGAAYLTELRLNDVVYVNNLMPPADPQLLPWVRGYFGIRNPGPEPLELVFTGCVSLTLSLVDEHGSVILTAHADNGGCCVCPFLLPVTVAPSRALYVPFRFQLVANDQQPVPDGFYGLRAVLNTVEEEPLRPAVNARIEVRSVF